MQLNYLEYVPDQFRDQAVKLCFLALKDKLEPLLGFDGRGIKSISINMATNRCIIAICDQQLAGILGIQSDEGGFLNPSLKMLVKSYGVFGGIFRMGGLALLHHSTARDWRCPEAFFCKAAISWSLIIYAFFLSKLKRSDCRLKRCNINKQWGIHT